MSEPQQGGPKYRGGCTPGMRVARPGVPGCRASCGHRAIVEEYRDARAAWEALRESDTLVPAAHAGGGMTAAYQLEADDFAAAYPPPTFRAWLEGLAGRNQEPQ